MSSSWIDLITLFNKGEIELNFFIQYKLLNILNGEWLEVIIANYFVGGEVTID